MQVSNIPAKFPIPFANGAGSGFIRTIPQASQIGITNGAASLTDGFPPVCFQPVGAGGTPPSGQDFNGILNEITAWNRWGQAGAPVFWDSTFSASIGGYPKGAIVSNLTVLGNFWFNLVDNNTSNPDAGGANWSSFSAATPGSLIHFGVDTGAANAYVVTSANLNPPISAYNDGMVVILSVANASTGASTINIAGIGAVAITRADGTAVLAGDLQTGARAQLIYDAATSSFLIAGVYTSAQPARNITSYTTAGTYTFTVPSGIYWLYVRLVGAGGGGGGGGGTATWAGGGGGSGGYSEKWVPVTPGQAITVTVGAGGTSGGSANGNQGGTGGTTSFGSYLQATGGQGGYAGTSTSAGGIYGVGSGGTINLQGALGGEGNITSANVQGGQGGASAFGGGGRTSTVTSAANGTAPGSGGGGIWQTGGAAAVGGQGAAGAVFVLY